MNDARARDLSSTAKLARLVLENCGPLSATELAAEARLSEGDAREALDELAASDLAQCVCGLCHSREEVYEYTGADEAGGADERSA